MTDLSQLLQDIDTLSSDELDAVYRHVARRRKTRYWLVAGEQIERLQEIMRPVHDESRHYTDAEIDEAIDEALDEVRRERRNTPDHRH